MSHYLHELPGRLRIRIPALRQSSHKARNIERSLKNLPGVHSVSINPVTGSLLVYFDPECIQSRAILNILHREKCITSTTAVSQAPEDNALDKMGEAVSKAVITFLLDRALQGTPFSIVTAFI
jgi:copper chaperone CopZ